MMLQAMDAVGASASETVMIGDTSFDMLMARAAKARGIGVGWGYHDAAELLRAGARKVAGDFEELLEDLLPRGGVVAA
jgi:phosphoglycolate phosphatase